MDLSEYSKKRHFDKTSEPRAFYPDNRLRFVIQRHGARNLHYDLRLEADGVLKSWAIPKGPSLNPADKRMAVMTEDHPINYLYFEGEIPKGNYGAGFVEIWDDGFFFVDLDKSTFYNEKEILEGIKKGKLSFSINGKKIKGKFNLVRIRADRDKENWLLIKADDKYSVDTEYSAEMFINPFSKIPQEIGKTNQLDEGFKNQAKLRENHENEMNKSDFSEEPNESENKTAKEKSHTQKLLFSPMLCETGNEPFSDDNWIYETKWDGYRALANIDKEQSKVMLYSRNKISFNKKYPKVVEALQKIPHNAVLDGEIVVLDQNGNPNFNYLQNYDENQDKEIIYYVFDLLFLNGISLLELPLVKRKTFLEKIVPESPIVRLSKSYEDGISLFKKSEKEGLEGIIAKKSESTYRPGARSRQWVKIKHTKKREAIIAGFTEPQGSRNYFGSLILGEYEDNDLRYIGNMGTGFDEASLKTLYQKLKPLIKDRSPFKHKPKTKTRPTWVSPQLVCEISYKEMTPEHHMRHPVFLSLKETEQEQKEVKQARHELSYCAKELQKANKTREDKLELNFDQITIPLSNPDKVFWQEEGYTKKDLMNYYLEMADWILPHLKDRPQSLNRHPQGMQEEGFFQKDIGNLQKDWMETTTISSESAEKDITYLLCQNKATLAYMANLGCIEINPWLSRVQSLENPDFVAIDLDPANNSFEQVIEVALQVKEFLDKSGAKSFCKTSGSSGIHIYIPLNTNYPYEVGRNFTQVIAELVHDQLPSLTSTERNPKARKNQIYLDCLQNVHGKTLASVYSVRPRKGATVSTPLEWKEVKSGLHPSDFTIKNIPDRVKKKGDLFENVLKESNDILKCLKNLGA